MDVLSSLLHNHSNKAQNILCGMTMLLGNAREDGQLIRHILQKGLGDHVLRLYLTMLS